MNNKETREIVGARMKMRRKEMKVPLQYIADKLGVSTSTVHRYENGSIDTSKKRILENIARVLHVSPEWLLGETDELMSGTADPSLGKIIDIFNEIITCYPLKADERTNEFSRDLLQLLLIEVRYFNQSFTNAVSMYSIDNKKYALLMEMDNADEYNRVMFRREIMRTINDFDRIVEILHDYVNNPVKAGKIIKKMLGDFNVLSDKDNFDH